MSWFSHSAGHLETMKTEARRKVIRRGGQVFGVGLSGTRTEPCVVVYINNRELPRALADPLFVNDHVPVKIELRGFPRLAPAAE